MPKTIEDLNVTEMDAVNGGNPLNLIQDANEMYLSAKKFCADFAAGFADGFKDGS